jgi:hypothetical protein
MLGADAEDAVQQVERTAKSVMLAPFGAKPQAQ